MAALPAPSPRAASARDANPSQRELHALVDAAARAPSADNMQPWAFRYEDAGRAILVLRDECRHPAPMGTGLLFANIACGAAAANILSRADEWGWSAEVEWLSNSQGAAQPAQPVARVRMLERTRLDNPTAAEQSPIERRATNRKLYDARPASDATLAALRASCRHSVWFTARADVEALAALVARADGEIFAMPAMRRALLERVRFDLPRSAVAEEGLPQAALEVSRVQALALRCMVKLPVRWAGVLGFARMAAAHAGRMVRSASGVLVVTGNDAEACSELRSGLAMQLAWLALVRHGLCAQPMMSLCVLDYLERKESFDAVAPSPRKRIAGIASAFRAFLRERGVIGPPEVLLRFGYAPEPSGRTGRRSPILSDD